MRDETPVTTTPKPVEFETYFREDLKPLVWYAQRIGASLPEAEDAVQEAMRSLWAHQKTVENPAAYTRQAVRRVLRRARGKAKRVREAEMTSRMAEANGTHVENDPFDTDVQSVITMLQALPKTQREVFALHMDGWETEAIAEITEQKPATVRSNLRHARQKLIHMIEQQTNEATGKEAKNGP